jgi:hypothetical protein
MAPMRLMTSSHDQSHRSYAGALMKLNLTEWMVRAWMWFAICAPPGSVH